ncbi:MAG: amino acid ABC transporter substrate-binding protein [Candidatus Aureabacteria bacterium]|nr:amino acid ABC transporter substrate-binding protein [Candidatus Auribacterota bacterium]
MAKTLRLFFMFFFFMIPLPAVYAADEGKPAAEPALRVGTTPDYPPLIFKKDGKYEGIEAELAALLSKELGRKIVFVDLPMDSIFSVLQDGKVDIIMSGISVTWERQKLARFLFPFMTINQMAVVRKDMESHFESPESIYNTNRKVGFGKGTTGELLVRENMKNAQGIAFSSPDEALSALNKKEIDLFIYDSPYIWNFFNEKKDSELTGLFWPLTEEDLAWAVRQSDTELADRVNNIVVKWKRNGTTAKIIHKWIRVKRTIVASGDVT